jgi:nicotinate-nucleotide pyrophosphorylase
MIDNLYIDNIITAALKEDMPMGDITTDSTIPEDVTTKAYLVAKEEGVLAGLDVAERVFQILGTSTVFNRKKEDGDDLKKGDIIAEIDGNARELLKGERTALNILQRMSGIATAAKAFSDKIKDLPASVVDTRKTTPGLRYLEKYAVRVGGGSNHRFCLSDGVLIKDNHIAACGGIKSAVERAKRSVPHTVKIEVETESLEQVKEALESGADIIMLDNMSLELMSEAVKLINKRALVEASGNVNLERVRDIALTGVDIISVGSITHSVNALDISLRIKI